MRPLEGIIIPAITPFDETGALRLDYLKNNYELWNKTCVQGYMALGSNGEFRSLDDDEAFAVLKAASEAAAPDKLFIGGIGRESLAHMSISSSFPQKSPSNSMSLSDGYFQN